MEKHFQKKDIFSSIAYQWSPNLLKDFSLSQVLRQITYLVSLLIGPQINNGSQLFNFFKQTLDVDIDCTCLTANHYFAIPGTVKVTIEGTRTKY